MVLIGISPVALVSVFACAYWPEEKYSPGTVDSGPLFGLIVTWFPLFAADWREKGASFELLMPLLLLSCLVIAESV